jgi:hypothetical protein
MSDVKQIVDSLHAAAFKCFPGIPLIANGLVGITSHAEHIDAFERL